MIQFHALKMSFYRHSSKFCEVAKLARITHTSLVGPSGTWSQ